MVLPSDSEVAENVDVDGLVPKDSGAIIPVDSGASEHSSGSGNLITRKRGSLPADSEPAAKKTATPKKKDPNDNDSSLPFGSPGPCDSMRRYLRIYLPRHRTIVWEKITWLKRKMFSAKVLPLSPATRGLGLYEKTRPSQVIGDSSAVYTPDWSVTRGSVLNTLSDRMGFMLRSLPPGIQDVFAQGPNSKLIDTYAHSMIYSLAAGQELINRVTKYETDVRSCLGGISALGHDEYRRRKSEEVSKLNVQVRGLHASNRTKLIKIKSLESELSSCRKAVGDVEYMSDSLKIEKERYKRLESENIKTQVVLKKELNEERRKFSILKGQLEAMKVEAERVKKKVFKEVIPCVVSKVKSCSDFIEPFKKVISASAGMGRRFQSALTKLHEDGVFGEIPLESVRYYDDSSSLEYDLANLDELSLPYVDKVASSFDMDIDDILAMEP